MGVRLYSDAPGFSIAQQANLTFYLTPRDVRFVLLGLFAVTMLIILAPRLLAGRTRLVGVLMAVLGVGIVAWNLTGEISAAANTNFIARQFGASLVRPFSWVDAVTKGRPTLYYDQGVSDQTAEWMLEFWNRSIAGATSLDGTIHGPGPAGAPNIAANGTLETAASPLGSASQYATRSRACRASTSQGRRWPSTTTTRPTGSACGASSSCRTRSASARSASASPPTAGRARSTAPTTASSAAAGGWLRIDVSRRDWSGPTPPSPVHVLVGKLTTSDLEPALGKVTRQVDLTIASGQTHAPVWVHVTTPSFAARVVVDGKFVPCQVEPAFGDCRILGAEVSYRFFRSRPSGKPRTGA